VKLLLDHIDEASKLIVAGLSRTEERTKASARAPKKRTRA